MDVGPGFQYLVNGLPSSVMTIHETIMPLRASRGQDGGSLLVCQVLSGWSRCLTDDCVLRSDVVGSGWLRTGC